VRPRRCLLTACQSSSQRSHLPIVCAALSFHHPLPALACAPVSCLPCRWHFFDAVIITASLALELSLRGIAREVASLLIFFR
jgi:hypothetical protein